MHNNIMIVDDNPIDQYVSQSIIERCFFAGNVIVKDNSQSALQYLSSNVEKKEMLPDIIFLDINMPGMNGFQFLEIFETLPKEVKEHCKVVMLTSSVNPADKDRANLSPYLIDYLDKPLSEEKLTGISEMAIAMR